MVFATNFEMNYDVAFVEGKTTDIQQDSMVFHFVLGASLARSMQHVRITDFSLRNLMSFEYFMTSDESKFRFRHVDNITLESCSDICVFLLMKAASSYLLNTDSPKSYFYCRSLYSAAYKDFQALHVSVETICFFNGAKFVEAAFIDFLSSEAPLTDTITTTMLQIIHDNINLFFIKAVTV